MDEIQQNRMTRGAENLMQKISFVILLVGFCVFPFFAAPVGSVPFAVSKMILFSVVTLGALAVFLLSIIQSGKISVPKNLLCTSLVLVALSFVASSFVQGGGVMMNFGYGFEVGTTVYMVIALALVGLSSHVVRGDQRQVMLYSGLLASALVVGIFQVAQVITNGSGLGIAALSGVTSNLVGTFNDLGLFFGLTLIISLITLETVALKKIYRLVVNTVFFLSLALLAIVNFSTLWIVLAVFSVLYFLYVYSFEKRGGQGSIRKISIRSIVVLIVSIAFIMFGQSLGGAISEQFGTSAVEVRPSWTTTLEVTKQALGENLLFGSGPNTFSENWLKHKPAGVNETVFWNTDFTYGIGLIPTYISTTGLIGLIAWVFFFAMLLLYGLRALYFSANDTLTRYFLVVPFFASLFMWVMSVVYIPGIVTSGLTFLFTGLFFANLYSTSLLKESEVAFEHYPKLSFVIIVLLIGLLVGVITLGYSVLQKNISQIYFNASILQYQKDSNLSVAEANIERAIATQNYDTYHRGLTELNLIKVDTLLADTKKTEKEVRDEFQVYIAKSIENAREATVVNKDNYLNWLVLSQVYGALAAKPFEIPGAYESAKDSYGKALLANPHNPYILLSIARLEVTKGDLPSARDFANKAIAQKQNYADAHFLLAQIEATEGNVAKAIPALETTIILTPNSPGLYFQLGLLKYGNADYVGAISAFESAVSLVPEYANAKYFLGLSYSQTNRTPEAIAQFEGLVVSNPDNAEVAIILDNLKAGRSAFDSTTATLDPKPEKRSELPLKETN